MGETDIAILIDINRKIIQFCKDNDLPFIFKTDDGTFETAIEFCQNRIYHPPISNSWDECKEMGNEIKCPDLLDYEHKLIIEYEEEPKPGKKGGKLGKKGHTEESDRDTTRDSLYEIGKFKLFKLWETDYREGNWKKLYDFLLEN